MTFAGIPSGAAIFLDANVFVYHFTKDPKYGSACTHVLKRVESGDLLGFTSTHVLADVAHRLMTVEAFYRLGWPAAGIAPRLRKHRGEIPKLSLYQQAIAGIPISGIQVLPVTQPEVETATLLSQQYELLTGDALLVAAMRQRGLTNLASEDADFDSVPGLIR